MAGHTHLSVTRQARSVQFTIYLTIAAAQVLISYTDLTSAQYVVPIHDRLCNIPETLQGEWFSREDGTNVLTTIRSDEVTNRGRCLALSAHRSDNFTLVLHQPFR